MQWGYPDLIRWHDALNLPIVKAGRLWGMTGPLGVAGDFTGNMTYFGVCHLFQRETGLYTAALMRDGRTGGAGPDIGQPEGQGGQFVRLKTSPDGPDRTFLIAGGQDSRVTEVLGLDTIKPLAGGTYVHGETEAELAKQKLDEYNALIAESRRLTIARGRKALDLAPPVEKTLDAERRFEARAAYDKQNLYVRFDVTSPHELGNSISDPQLVFKGGNCLDIQLAADPQADPQRKEPAPGDVRLLVTRQKGQRFVVVYRPKVRDFAGDPIVLKSPTGEESFDVIGTTDVVGLEYRKTADGFRAVVTIPHALTGWKPLPGSAVKMDLGYRFGNANGSSVAARAYWRNNSFTANVVNDIPHESRLEPHEWGDALVE
jgi:hypothetical protein